MNLIQKTRDDYNKIARHFADTRQALWPELEQFKPFLEDGQYILDWGCGNGRLLTLLAPYDIKYFGVDQSNELLKIARKKHAAAVKAGRAHFYCTAHQEKKFPPNYFDLVFMVASFFHLPDQKSRVQLLKKIYREMKPGSKLLMTLWNLESDWAKDKRKKGWKEIGKQDFLVPWKNLQGKIEVERYYHSFTPEEIKELLTSAQLTVDTVGYFDQATWSDDKHGKNLIVIAKK